MRPHTWAPGLEYFIWRRKRGRTLTQETNLAIIEQAAEIVAAYVTHNALSATDVPGLIASVHTALLALGTPVAAVAHAEPVGPAVPIKRSISVDAITCLDCGLKFKSMRRHIRASHDMTPDLYRAKWRLPSDYPMVAPNYSKARSGLAKSIGLGVKR